MSVSVSSTPAARGQCQTIDLAGKIALLEGFWQQRVVAEMNDYQFKVARDLRDFAPRLFQ